jgi:DNA polymerase III subunit delta'
MMYPWLHSHYQSMVKAWQQGVMPHALLISGIQGVGKHALADSIVEYILCEDKQGDSACGHCRGCQLSQSGNHPDWIQLGLEEKSKTLKISQIRKLSQQLNQTPYAGRQVAVVNPACQMNLAAANALLKTLEEPTGKVLLILIVYNASRLPATILSRCQKLHVTINNPELAMTWLHKQYPAEQPERLWGHTHGAPLLASTLLEQDYFMFRDKVLSCLEQSMFSNVNPLPVVPELLKFDISLVLRILFLITIDCIKLSMQHDITGLSNQDQYAVVLKIASAVSSPLWFDFYSQLLEVQATLDTGIAVNKQLLVESLMLRWLDLCR